MAAKAGKQWWDPYETSNRRQFVHRLNSTTETLSCPASTSLIDSYSHSGPFGSSVYNKDFSWKPVCKPECIRTGTASGQRRNNPHPRQTFMIRRQPRNAARACEYVGFPRRGPPSEGEIRKALTAQYRSTYRCDFVALRQGYDPVNNAEGRLAPKHSRREVPHCFGTETRDNYRPPKQKPELLHCSYSTDPNPTRGGIENAKDARPNNRDQVNNLPAQQTGFGAGLP